MNSIKDEKGNIKLDTIAIQRIIKNYYKQVYAHKSEDLRETDRSLDSYTLPKLSQEATGNVKKPVREAEIESVIKTLPRKESLTPDGCTAEFHKVFQIELIPILHKLFKTIEGEEILRSLLYKASITLIPKPDRELQTNILEYKTQKSLTLNIRYKIAEH